MIGYKHGKECMHDNAIETQKKVDAYRYNMNQFIAFYKLHHPMQTVIYCEYESHKWMYLLASIYRIYTRQYYLIRPFKLHFVHISLSAFLGRATQVYLLLLTVQC